MNSSTQSADAAVPAQRSDAVRNRARILDAAATAFALHGSSVSIEQVAREAGVGAGTIYRHFANRDALLEAIVSQRIDEIVTSVRSAVGSPGHVLFQLIEMMGRTAVLDEGLTRAIADATVDGGQLVAVEAVFMQLLDELVEAAHRSGELRRDVSARSVKAMIVGQQSVARTGDSAAAAAHLAVIERGARLSSSEAS